MKNNQADFTNKESALLHKALKRKSWSDFYFTGWPLP